MNPSQIRLIVITTNLPWAVTWADLKISYDDGASQLHERLVISRTEEAGDRFRSTLHCYVDSVETESGTTGINHMIPEESDHRVGVVELYGMGKSMALMAKVDFGLGVDSDWKFGNELVKVWLLKHQN